MGVGLYDYQIKAVNQMKNGCILCGGVGSGKSRTALAYYYTENGGEITGHADHHYVKMKKNQDLYIITTARKRDTLEWEGDMAPFYISTDSKCDLYKHKVVVDSWNNIEKYIGVQNAFFIFDEQRVVGSGKWVKSFLKITRANRWILLSATPGDSWSDYIPVFIANGFYKNRTEFIREHVIYKRFSKFPQIDRYIATGRLLRLRDKILVNMDFQRQTIAHHETVYVPYDLETYKYARKNRWDVFKDKPFESASELCYCLQKIVNSDKARLQAVESIIYDKKHVIIFYNFDYELEALKTLTEGIEGLVTAEWNGHKHQDVPAGNLWAYFVQYNAGAEGWNCVRTDTIIFYSQNYSYKVMVQASGRIDRLNTPYTDLYYYHLKSHADIDLAISKALKNKKQFNESRFA